MAVFEAVRELTYQERLEGLRETKLQQTLDKQRIVGSMDHDDWAQILPPEPFRDVTRAISGSGEEVTDVRIKGLEMVPNHPSGGIFGPRAVGANFRRLLEAHPVYVDPIGSLAGNYMVNYNSYLPLGWNPDFKFDHLVPAIEKYGLGPGIGAKQHFCQDLQIGFDLGWGGLLDKIQHYRQVNAPHGEDLYDGLEDVARGMQDWIGRTADACLELAAAEQNPQLAENLREMAEMNAWIVSNPPRTFREACQWMVWYQMAARMFNGSGSLGRLDVLLTPYYERDMAAGMLSEEEATFHIANLLLRDTAYLQLGGPNAAGEDVTNKVSFLVLEAAHALKIPANVGVSVGPHVNPDLLTRSVEIQFEDKTGIPKFLGVEQTADGFARNGYPVDLGRERAYSGCHWSAIPGREYTVNDCVKINLAKVFEVALQDMMGRQNASPSLELLWEIYQGHMRVGIDTIKEALDFHLAHMRDVMPELVLDLLSHGVIEKGLDAADGGVEYYNLCLDAAALATVADSFAAIEQRVVNEGRLTWSELMGHLESDWAGAQGERARLMMKGIRRFGYGGSLGDKWAQRVSQSFTEVVKESPTPKGRNVIPGIFSWAQTIRLGQQVGATPNGRHAHAPISHGASPDPGFRRDGAPSAMAEAVAKVQPGWGNTAPLQLDFDPGITREEGGVEQVANLIRTHFELGGTQINMNVMDAAQVLEAHEDPSKHPDLVVRVTGFSAYFSSLSKEFRQLVVDRLIDEGA